MTQVNPGLEELVTSRRYDDGETSLPEWRCSNAVLARSFWARKAKCQPIAAADHGLTETFELADTQAQTEPALLQSCVRQVLQMGNPW